MLYKNILQTIGNTPLISINHFSYRPEIRVFAKLEGFNPSGSIKDRVAFNLIRRAEDRGELDRSKTIIEPTSGNTGIGLAMVAVLMGYKIIVVMSEGVSIERRKILNALGAKIYLTPAIDGTDGAIRMVRAIVETEPQKYFFPDQYSNQDNPDTHYRQTAEEIWLDTNGKTDFLVASIGTGGTLTGIGRALKEKNPNVKIVSAHPVIGHQIQGLKNMQEAVIPKIYDPEIIDITIPVDDKSAFATTREIALKEGILVGMSSGAALYAANQIAQKIDKGNIVTIFPDRGEKYLSTSLFEI